MDAFNELLLAPPLPLALDGVVVTVLKMDVYNRVTLEYNMNSSTNIDSIIY
jgi:hypothetical protein